MAAHPISLQAGEFEDAPASNAPISLSAGEFEDAPAQSPAQVAPPRDTVGDFNAQQKAAVGSSPTISTQALTLTRTPFDKPTYNPADAAVEQTQGPGYAMRPNAAAPQTVGDIAPAARAGATLTPAARAPLAQPSARTPVQMQTPQDKVDTGLSNAQSYETEANAALGSKVTDAATSVPKDLYQGVQKTVGQTGEDFDRAKFVKGITQLVSGGSKAAIVLSAPELMELGAAADAGNVAAQGSIIKILAAAEAGNIANDASGVAADKLHLSPETKELIQTAAFFLPTLAGAMKFKGGAGVDAKGNPGIGFSSEKGGVRAGAVGTPEAYDIRAQVGGTRVGVKIPRQAPPDPAQMLQAQQAEAGASAIIRAATKQKQAATVAAGGPPPPPPGPTLPDAMQKGVITPQNVQDIATMIHLAPVEQHPQLIMEAHGKLTEYIEKQGRIIDPDGKLQLADTPQKAAKLAADIINGEVDRQQTAKEDAAKQQEQVAKDQEKAAKEANKPGEDGALSPADQQWARAKTIIESTTLKPGQSITSVLQRNLRVGPGTANEMMQRYQKEKTEEALPTVGSKKEPVVEESRATVDAQIEAMKRGDTNVVMLPEGSKYMPKVPDGMKMMSVTGDSPGAGKYLYNPQNIRAATIKEAAKAGTHGDLMGHLQPKAEIAAAPEKQTVVVQAQDKATGTPIQDSEVHPERVAEQTDVMKERHPDAKIVVKPTHEVLIDRLEAQNEEEPKGDIFDEAAKPVALEPGEFEETKPEPKKELTPLEKHGPLISKSLQTGKVTVIPEPAESTPAKEVVQSKEKETAVAKIKEPEAAAQTEEPVSAAPKTSNEGAKKEVTPLAKGDTVTFKDRTGKMQTGTIAHAGDRMVRVKVDGKEYTTFRGGVKPAEVTDNLPPVTRDSGAGDKSTQPKQETPAGVPSYEELLAKLDVVPRDLMAPGIPSDEDFLRYGRIPIPEKQKDIRERVNEIVRARYEHAVKLYRDLPEQIEGFRAVQVPNGIEDIRRDNLGKYWSDKESGAKAYHADTRKDGKTVILRGTFEKGQLDVARTILARMRSSTGVDESELNLKNGASPTQVSYKYADEKDWNALSDSSPAPSNGAVKPVNNLIDAIYDKLEAGESLGNVTELNKLAEQHLGASRTSGEWTPKDLFDAMEAAVNKWIVKHGADLMKMDAVDGLGELRKLMGRITTQGVRTEDQIKNQQFSTPPTESYVVAKVAALTKNDVVLEPSAGNGGIAAWPLSIGAKVYVNEIATRRQKMLKAVGFDDPTAHDGELINALLDHSIKPTVILMNPPFSASTLKSYEAKNQSRYGYNHVTQALQRLAPGGRLIAILGGGREGFRGGEGASLRTGESGKWFDQIAEEYNVRANIRVDGSEYQKYGTAYSTRIIVIDKDGPTPSRNLEWVRANGRSGPSWDSVVEHDVDTLEEAYNALKPVAESRPSNVATRPGNDNSPAKSSPAGSLGPDTDAGVSGVRAPAGGSGRAPAEVPASVRPDRTGPGATASRPEGGPEQLQVHRPGSETERNNEGEAARGAGTSAANGDGQRQVAERGLDLEREEAQHQREEEGEDESAFTAYKPTIKGAKHPGSIVETKSMATVPMPPITYKPNLPESVVGKGPDFANAKLSAVQLEAVAVAGMQNEILLPGGFRASALIGDGTGVGKGREGAAILWDNWRKGRRRLVWMTKSKDLIVDAVRDLEGLGAHDLAKSIKSLGKVDATTPIAHEGVLFTTYALFRSGDKKGNTRASQVDKWLRGEDGGNGGYLLMDESHNLKNAVVSKGGQASQIGQTVKQFLEKMPSLRTVSLSATAATDVMNLGYLDRLGLWGPGTPFPGGFNQFAGEIAHGGMSAMEMIARELKAQGKYVSRTLTYRGVKYSETQHEITPDQKAIYATAAKAWRTIFESVESTIGNVTGGGGRQKAMAMSQFFSTQQRFFNLLLTSIKIPTAVKSAEKALAEGKSVAITLINTNEAAQNREKDRVAAEDSDEEPDYDFGPGKMLTDMVQEHYPTQQYKDDVDSNGNPTKVPVVDDKGNPVQNPEALRRRDELLKQLEQLHMPANPLDELIDLLGGPTKVAELTGRKQRYDPATNRLVNRGGSGVSQDKVNKAEEHNFQSGKKRIAILSSAADTGISLHSDKGAKNQQQRYVITLQVGWSADKQMQMNGRFNRSNQLNAPEYDLLKTDLGGESRFISSIARRMESLEALSKGQTKTNAGTDAMSKVNFETDQGRAASVAFYNSLLMNRDVPGAFNEQGEQMTGRDILKELRVLKAQSGGGETVPPADRANVTRLLNRLLALDPDVQQAVYNYFYDIFDATVRRAVEDGTLDTGVKRLPGDTFTVKEQRTLSADPATGAKTFYYPIEANVRVHKMNAEKMEERYDKLKKNSESPVLRRGPKGELALTSKANPIVHADGNTVDAVHVWKPDAMYPVKLPERQFSQWKAVDAEARDKVEQAEDDLDRAQRDIEYYGKLAEKTANEHYKQMYQGDVKKAEVIRDAAKETLKEAKGELRKTKPVELARDEWQKQHDDAPAHIPKEHHLIGGAVMRFWNAIRESTHRMEVYSAVDQESGQRVVGIEIPSSQIRKLLDRITGGKSTVNAEQVVQDVLQNATQYDLEGGIKVRRGRVAGTNVVQLVTTNSAVQDELKDLGVLYERGVQPIYYLPTGNHARAEGILDKVLKQYPAKAPEATGEGSSGVVLRSSFLGAEKLVEFMADQGQKLWEKDIAPHIPGAIEGFKRAATQTAALLYPRIGANQDALDSLFKAKGEREKARFMLDRMEGGLEKFFDKMPEAARLAFIDRYKMGVGQLDPTLQKIETLMRTIDKATFDRAQVYKPSMTAKEDHYRVLWKVIPDPSGKQQNPTARPGVGQGRRPFEGDKGFMRRATLDTISEGIHYGGVPVSTNPWKMFTLAQQSMMQYITAQDHWRDLKKLGLRKFVKPGQKRPDGWVKLDDRIAKSFFSAEVLTKDLDDLPSWQKGKGKSAFDVVAKEDVEDSTRRAYIPVGEWYLEPSAGRTLNNYLSRDLIRENAIGNVLMAAKNLSTAIELGLSPFHFAFETVEAMGSQLGLGVQRLWNNGIRLGEGAEAMKGVKEIATSMAAPVLMARAGGSLLKMVDNPQAFAKTRRGAAFLRQYPDAATILDELFTGGYQWGMNPDYKFDPVKSMRQTITDKNYGGAMWRLVPWINHVIMAPLFEHYIPREKLGFALAQYSQQLVENRRALANGDTTRAAIARKVIDSAENRFGEMNFSNLLWNNTFKSVAQFMFRSITWKLGNWRGLGTAGTEILQQGLKDPIAALIEDAKAGKKQRPAGEYVPKIGMNLAWLIGMAATTAVLGTILTKLWTDKYPWEFAEGDDGHLALEMSHPRTGQVDARTGKPERISLPTGFKDFEHAYLHPREYLRGSMSGTAGNFVDLAENKDFFGNYVYDPNAPLYQQVAEAVKYSLPKPIAAQGFTDKHGGQSTMTKVLKTAGLAPTSRERDLTPAEARMQEILRARRTPLTPKHVKDREDQDAIVKTPTVRQMHMALKAGHKEYIEKEFKNMSYADAREVYYHLATPAERRILKADMDKKRMNLLKRNPDAVRRADAQP